MNRRPLFILSVIVLLSSLGIRTVCAEATLQQTDVSYTASRPVIYDGPMGMIDFTVTATLECVVTYNCSATGVLPPSSTCHLNATPKSATLTVEYHIERPIGSDIDGSQSIPLPVEELSGLLGDSPPIVIPIDTIGTITIVIHGHLVGNLTLDIGSADPTSVEWSTWTPQDTVVSASVSTVNLTMATTYQVSFTVTVSIPPFDPVSRDSTVDQVAGEPSHECVIPEFSSLLILPIFMTAILLAVIVYRKKTDKSQELKSPHRN